MSPTIESQNAQNCIKGEEFLEGTKVSGYKVLKLDMKFDQLGWDEVTVHVKQWQLQQHANEPHLLQHCQK